MSMDFQEIVAVALDEWEQDEKKVGGDSRLRESGDGVVPESPTEDAFGIKFPKLGGGSKAPSVNPPKPPKADAGPKKMGKSETAQAQALAGKSQAEQTQSLADHDAIYHKNHPYDPNTSTCKLRQKLVETQKAMGMPISERQARAMNISKKDLDAGNHEGNKKISDAKNGGENADPMINEIREMRKKNQSLTGEEREKADAELQAKCIEFAKKNLGEAEGEAVEGLFNKIKVAGANMAQRIKDAFAKRDDSQMSEAAKEVKEAVIEKADEAIAGGEESGNEEEKVEGAETGTGRLSQTETTGGEETPNEKPQAAQPPTLRDAQPKAQPDEIQIEALNETIGELDSEFNNEELTPYERNKRLVEVANRAARYIDDWRDLDDPEKRQAAVEMALKDLEQAKAEGKKLDSVENEAFSITESKNRKDLSKDVDSAREELENLFSDPDATPEDKQRARDAFNEARKASEERLSNPTEEDLFEDKQSAKGEFEAKSKELEDANAQLSKAQEDLKAAEASGDKEAAKAAKAAADDAQSAVEAAKAAKEEAESKYKEASDNFDNYEPPKNENDMVVDRTKEALAKAGISEEALKRFEQREALLRDAPDFYKNHPELLENFRKDAEAWTRIKTDNPAMQELQRSLMDVASDDIQTAKFKRTAMEDYQKLAKSKDPDIAAAAKMAISRIEKNEDPYKVHKDFASEQRTIAGERRKEELHNLRVQREQLNNAKAAEQQWAAQMANKAKYREETVAQSDPEIVSAVTEELNAETDPTRKAQLKNIIKTLNEDTTNKNIKDALNAFEKGWSETAKGKVALAKIKEMREREDYLEKTWAETNKDGRLKDLDAAIEVLGKRKDDAGTAAAARLSEIRKELAKSHSEKRVQTLLKDWRTVVSGGRSKVNAKPTYDQPGAYDAHHENGGVLSAGKSVDANGNVVETPSNDQMPDPGNVLTSRPTIAKQEQKDEQEKLADVTNALANPPISATNGTSKVGVNRTKFTFDAASVPSDQVLKGIAASLQGVLKTKDVAVTADYVDGKAKINVTFPNTTRGDVDFKTGLVGTPKRQQAFENAKAKMALPIYIGDDEDGDPVYLDFKDLKHLLIGGQTGMGKSVSMNSMLGSMMLARSPKQLKIVAIDGKGNEFDTLDGSAHTAIPVAKTKEQIISSLQWLNQEEANRRKLFSETKAKYGLDEMRDIYQYNEWAKKNGKEEIPEIVVPIDEMTYINNIPGAGDMVANLAAIARSSGIHLMVGTQHPTQENIGNCKQNMPARIGLHTTSNGADAIFDDKEGYEKCDRPGSLMVEFEGKKIHAQGSRMADGDMARINKHFNTPPTTPKAAPASSTGTGNNGGGAA